MWQHAKVTFPKTTIEYLNLSRADFELWVIVKPPEKVTAGNETGFLGKMETYETNVRGPFPFQDKPVGLLPKWVELLGGPDAFKETVRIISWEQFLRGEDFDGGSHSFHDGHA